ncbi:DNA polymerase III sliding clamp [Arthrobacter phage HumptyDumpty]|uniref:DNA polymerase III sliding clamp n=5 Tax=Klausavirus princesstrina TaxID=1984784 RepID=A0A1J0GS45_9CAUD|nr:DNA polymerase processivity factor [Arthrobacter phage PrincessTrina]AOZ64655.1 DNA polymerase III sliding clamp [Arthrobacter phage Chubster]APC44897.1 DNA polymerase III sliding clamp [Arthrobacter phage HumptyDumpty]ASX98888.1 DNA polymerase III sliding clamp [Arthrobacter phage Kabreeze]ASX99112.1 DNA polymerase III sliding clamp [Arthrobacter phage Scavito]ALY09948.1 DNA polymerase III sliding clamp [Arthrobacter phage PrincessTrina]
MKLTIDSSALNEAVGFAARAVNPRHAQPVLTGLVLEAAGGTLSIRGFDQTKANAVEIAADIEEDGLVLLPGAVLANMLKALPTNKPLDLEVADRATLKVGRAKFSTPVMSMDNYPVLPGLPQRLGYVDSDVFAKAVGQIQHAAGRNSDVEVLNGIKVELRGDLLQFIATDRYRVAMAEIPIHRYEGTPHEADFLVLAEVLVNAARGGSGNMDVLGSEQRIGFVSATRTATANLMAGQYPPVHKLFPAAHMVANRATIDVDALLGAVTRAAVVVDGKNPIRLNFRQGEVIVDAGRADSNAGEEAVECWHDFEGPKAVGFNPTYLAEGLRSLATPQAVFGFHAETGVKPISLTDSGDMVTNKQLLMPMRLESI